ncbi:hypothetical protein COP2_031131 [Malus domestica]
MRLACIPSTLVSQSATSTSQAILGSSQAEQPKQWSLPQHLLSPYRADFWPLPANVPHHPNGCPATTLSEKKTRKLKFFLRWYGAEKMKKATKDDHLHRQV